MTVFNLSSKTLDQFHLSILNRGLSFVPTNHLKKFDIKVDLFKFFRQLRLREFFDNGTEQDDLNSQTASNTEESRKVFRGKSLFMPPVNRNNSIETYCRLVEQEVDAFLNENQRSAYNNLSKEEKKALEDLKSDDSIVIKPADKGGATVVMNKIDYVEECVRQLSDRNFYEVLPDNPTQAFKCMILDTLNDLLHQGEISRDEFNFLKIEHPIVPTFYILPKIHKRLECPPGRPIVANIGSVTSNLSTFVDHFIRPLAEGLPSFTKDTGHVINIVESVTLGEEEVFLASFDINAMYTVIPHDGGLIALDHYLNDPSMYPSKESILTLTKLILEYNYWIFQDTFYKQKRGVPMGSAFSPSFANLYMGLFEEHYIYSNHSFRNNLILWKRYLDDVLCIFKGSLVELQMFFTYLNTCCEYLSFTMEYDKNKISFLDLWIIRNGAHLYTDLYRKPTARNTLLRADSEHPRHLKESLPFSQLCRVKRICKTPEDFRRNSDEMITNFSRRGYHKKVLNNAIEKVETIPRSNLLSTKNKVKSNKRIIFSTEYHRQSVTLRSIINKHWHILKSDTQLKSTFQEHPLIVYKRGKNLRDQLVHSYLPPNTYSSQPLLTPIPDGNRRCGSCTQCNYTYKCSKFKHPHTGKDIQIKGKISCNTTSVIYLLTCPCGKSYVGKTSRALKTRIAEHRSTIRCKNLNYPVAAHFVEFNHPISSLKYIGIERVTLPPRGGGPRPVIIKKGTFLDSPS